MAVLIFKIAAAGGRFQEELTVASDVYSISIHVIINIDDVSKRPYCMVLYIRVHTYE